MIYIADYQYNTMPASDSVIASLIFFASTKILAFSYFLNKASNNTGRHKVNRREHITQLRMKDSDLVA